MLDRAERAIKLAFAGPGAVGAWAFGRSEVRPSGEVLAALGFGPEYGSKLCHKGAASSITAGNGLKHSKTAILVICATSIASLGFWFNERVSSLAEVSNRIST